MDERKKDILVPHSEIRNVSHLDVNIEAKSVSIYSHVAPIDAIFKSGFLNGGITIINIE